MNVKRVVDGEGARKADLAAIHIAKARLAWTDDHYRDVLRTVCRVGSSAELDFAGRKRWLAHLQACLKAEGKVAVSERSYTKPKRKPLSPSAKKMWSLWMQICDAGKAHERTMKALEAFAARQTGVDKIDWLKSKQVELVIESLKQFLER